MKENSVTKIERSQRWKEGKDVESIKKKWGEKGGEKDECKKRHCEGQKEDEQEQMSETFNERN